MAYLAVVGSKAVNGVAAIHSEIIKETIFKASQRVPVPACACVHWELLCCVQNIYVHVCLCQLQLLAMYKLMACTSGLSCQAVHRSMLGLRFKL